MKKIDFLDHEKLRDALCRIALFVSVFESFSDFIEQNVTVLFYPKENISNILEYYEKGDLKKLTHPKEVFSFKEALDWFVDMRAITQQELELALQIRDLRNELVHKMSTHVYKGIPKELNIYHVELIRLYQKINMWWIENVEMTINSDLPPDIKPEKIHNLEILFLNLLKSMTLENH